jgi:cell division protein FtsL
MTFIQPTKHANILNILIVMLVVALLGGTFWIVIAYNKTVDISHDLASTKSKLDSLGAQNTALNNTVIATLGGGNFSQLAAANDLIRDKNPQYFSIAQQWPIASQ